MVILGTSFLSMLFMFNVMEEGITFDIKGHTIMFKIMKRNSMAWD